MATIRTFAQRLAAYLPLFGLRWVLILLNEFLPERWRAACWPARRESWAEAKARQLALRTRLPGRVAGKSGGLVNGY